MVAPVVNAATRTASDPFVTRRASFPPPETLFFTLVTIYNYGGNNNDNSNKIITHDSPRSCRPIRLFRFFFFYSPSTPEALYIRGGFFSLTRARRAIPYVTDRKAAEYKRGSRDSRRRGKRGTYLL